MNVDYINPFINATQKVLSTMAFLDSAPESPRIADEGEENKGVISAVIELTGGTHGSIAVSFTKPCILTIASNMLGDTFEDIDDELVDMVGEIVNMISGEARRELAGHGFHFVAGIPVTAQGKNHKIDHFVDSPTVLIPFSTENGNFYIEACFASHKYFKDVKNSGQNSQLETDTKSLKKIALKSFLAEAGPEFPAYILNPKSQKVRSNIFMLPEYVEASEGYDYINYNRIEVFVCPETFFASNKLKYFKSSANPNNPLLEDQQLRDYVLPKLEKMKIIDSLAQSFTDINRSVEQAITSYEIAIMSSTALFTYDGNKFMDELVKISEYSLKAALLAKSRRNVSEEIKFLKGAYRALTQLLATQSGVLLYSSITRLFALSLYLEDMPKAKKCYDLFKRRLKIESKSFTEQDLKRIKIFENRLDKLLAGRQKITFAQNRQSKSYLLLDN